MNETAHTTPARLEGTLPHGITGAIFDLDGTLLDSMPYWENLGENYLIRRGKTPHPDIHFHFKRLTLEGSAIFMKREYHLEESVEEIAEGIMAGIKDAYFESIPLKPGVVDLLDSLRAGGVRMCIATATERPCAEAALKRLGITSYFSHIFTCSEAGASKTEPLIFEQALEHLGTPRASTVVFEDALHAMETAHAAGFALVAVDEPASATDLQAIRELADVYAHQLGAWPF